MSTDPYQVTLTCVSRLDPSLAQEIDALAAVAQDPNVFYASWMLAAALEHLKTPKLSLVTVRHPSAGLTGVFPFELTRLRGLPIRCLQSWRHDYLFLCTPLLARDHALASLGALLDWSTSRQAPASVIEFNAVRDDGPFAATLREALAARPSFVTHRTSYERALLDLQVDFESGVSGKHHKELRRQERRLADLGELAYRALPVGESADEWVERFLALEARGWKGEEKTALASDTGSRGYFKDIAREAGRRSSLQMLELTLNGTPVATKCNFVAGEGSFAFKIAHDEEQAKFSPGVLLELFNMRYLKDEWRPQPAWMDSCAKAQHFMINRLWTQRRIIANHLVCGHGLLARSVVRNAPRITALRAKLQARRGKG